MAFRALANADKIPMTAHAVFMTACFYGVQEVDSARCGCGPFPACHVYLQDSHLTSLQLILMTYTVSICMWSVLMTTYTPGVASGGAPPTSSSQDPPVVLDFKAMRRRAQSGIEEVVTAVDNPGLHFVCVIPELGVSCGVCATSSQGANAQPVLLFNLSKTQSHMPITLVKQSDDRTKLFAADLCSNRGWDAAKTVRDGLEAVVLSDDRQHLNLSQCTEPAPNARPPGLIHFDGDSGGGLFNPRPDSAAMGLPASLAAPRAACYCHPDNGGECAPLLPVLGSLEGQGRVYRPDMYSRGRGSTTEADDPASGSGTPAADQVPEGSLTWSGVDVLSIDVGRGDAGQGSEAGDAHHEEVAVFSFGSPAMGWDGGDWTQDGGLVPGTGGGSSRENQGCFGRTGVTGRCAIVMVLSCDQNAFEEVEDDAGDNKEEEEGGASKVVRLDLERPPRVSDSIRDRNTRDACALVLERMGFDFNSDVQSICLRVFAAEACLYQPCPNACSAHGQCLPDGSCSCDQGWASADCSSEATCMEQGGCSEFATCRWQMAETGQGQGNGGGDGEDGPALRPTAVCTCRGGYRGDGQECSSDPRSGFAGPSNGGGAEGEVVVLFVLVAVLCVSVGTALMCILLRPWIAARCPACGKLLARCLGDGPGSASTVRARRELAQLRGRTGAHDDMEGTGIELESDSDGGTGVERGHGAAADAADVGALGVADHHGATRAATAV